MVYWSTEELTIRSNGTNRKASFTNGTIGEGVLTIRIRLCILDMDGNLFSLLDYCGMVLGKHVCDLKTKVKYKITWFFHATFKEIIIQW